jgi:hypothetical protein
MCGVVEMTSCEKKKAARSVERERIYYNILASLWKHAECIDYLGFFLFLLGMEALNFGLTLHTFPLEFLGNFFG